MVPAAHPHPNITKVPPLPKVMSFQYRHLFSVACPTRTSHFGMFFFFFLFFFGGGGGEGGIFSISWRIKERPFFCISNKYFYSDEYRDYRVLEGVRHICVTAELLE